MNNTIKQKDLEILVDRLNTNNGIKDAKHNTPNSYQLDMAYGGYKLVKVCNESGGVSTISSGGYGTKRELYNQIMTVINYGS
jgi:hypothetical protein